MPADPATADPWQQPGHRARGRAADSHYAGLLLSGVAQPTGFPLKSVPAGADWDKDVSRSAHSSFHVAGRFGRDGATGGLCRRLACLWFGLALAAAASAAEPVTITRIQQFWDLTADLRSQILPVDLECVVTRFDREWKLLWVQQDGVGAFVHIEDPLPVVQAGQRIRVHGELHPPNADILFDHATVEVLGPAELPVTPIQGEVANALRWRNLRVELDGLVNHQSLNGPTHLFLTLSIEGQNASAWVELRDTEPVPQLEDATVRVHGIYAPKITPSGEVAALELQIQSSADVTVLSRLAVDSRFELPLIAIEALPSLPPDRLVRIAGVVKAQDAGRYLRLRDATGQVDVISGQTRTLSINEQAEAVGYPRVQGSEWRLERGVYRSLTAPLPVPSVADTLAKIRVASQVLELEPDAARHAHPVQLTGIVTWAQHEVRFFYLQDASGGVRVERGPQDEANILTVGRQVQVRGTTGMGDFAPVVRSSEVIRLSDLGLPAARPISLDHALTGVEEAQWVEMSGYLRQAERRGHWIHLELTTAAGAFTAMLPPGEDASPFIGAVVRLHGVCSAQADARRKLTGINLWVPSVAHLQVEEPAPKDPFAVPARSLASLGQFGSEQSFNRRVHVSGVVLHHDVGHALRIADHGGSVLVLSREPTALTAGDRVDAVGFLGRQGGRVVLREAVYRRTGHETEPPPTPVTEPAEAVAALDGQLVRVEGRLIESSASPERMRLTVQAGRALIEAFLDARQPSTVDAWPEGSSLALTGVYDLRFDEDGKPRGFSLQLRSPADVTVLSRPSWFTRGRIIALASTLGLGVLLFTGWVWVLRRQVRRQTAQIREQVDREARLAAELQRASKLESLGLLAGGIAHDFNNLLTIVMGNLSLAQMVEQQDPEAAGCLREASRGVERARDLTQQLLTFAKGGAPIRMAVALADVVREVTQFALRGSKVSSEFVVADGLWAADVDKGQIAQVVQNIVINAVQAMPDGGRLDLRLQNVTVGDETGAVLSPGRYLKLEIADGGPGIAPPDLPRVFDPYFTTKKHGSGLGLATVYSIIKKHRGHVSLESTLGRGTTFHIWLPATAAPIGSDTAAGFARPTPPQAGTGRILFMDDEEDIRRLGRSMLERFGYEVATVNDGSAVVREYAQARNAGRPFDLVIVDLTVPGGVGGREAMEQLLKLDPAARGIVSSGYSNDQVLSHYREHGFRGMVSKPYEAADLMHTIHEVLKGKQA